MQENFCYIEQKYHKILEKEKKMCYNDMNK